MKPGMMVSSSPTSTAFTTSRLWLNMRHQPCFTTFLVSSCLILNLALLARWALPEFLAGFDRPSAPGVVESLPVISFDRPGFADVCDIEEDGDSEEILVEFAARGALPMLIPYRTYYVPSK